MELLQTGLFSQSEEQPKKEVLLLEEFRQRAIWAHNWTSFNPDKRGNQIISEFSADLQNSIDELKKAGVSVESINTFISKYKGFFSAWIGAKSKCASSAITGGSGFNVSRAEKANNSEHKKFEQFCNWAEWYKSKLIKALEPPKTVISELERYQQQLKAKIDEQEYMKLVNKAHKNYLKNPSSLDKVNISEKAKELIKTYVPTYSWTPHPFARFELSNNLANIKRLKGMVKKYESLNTKANTTGSKQFDFEGVAVIYNYEANRLQIKHDTKPNSEVITTLKKNGFKWSPSFGAWQRFLTRDSVEKASNILGVTLERI